MLTMSATSGATWPFDDRMIMGTITSMHGSAQTNMISDVRNIVSAAVPRR